MFVCFTSFSKRLVPIIWAQVLISEFEFSKGTKDRSEAKYSVVWLHLFCLLALCRVYFLRPCEEDRVMYVREQASPFISYRPWTIFCTLWDNFLTPVSINPLGCSMIFLLTVLVKCWVHSQIIHICLSVSSGSSSPISLFASCLFLFIHLLFYLSWFLLTILRTLKVCFFGEWVCVGMHVLHVSLKTYFDLQAFTIKDLPTGKSHLIPTFLSIHSIRFCFSFS